MAITTHTCETETGAELCSAPDCEPCRIDRDETEAAAGVQDAGDLDEGNGTMADEGRKIEDRQAMAEFLVEAVEHHSQTVEAQGDAEVPEDVEIVAEPVPSGETCGIRIALEGGRVFVLKFIEWPS